jgi:hypothetical protein
MEKKKLNLLEKATIDGLKEEIEKRDLKKHPDVLKFIKENKDFQNLREGILKDIGEEEGKEILNNILEGIKEEKEKHKKDKK